jgi:alpha-L-fucosidase
MKAPIPSNPQTDASMQTFRKYGLGQMIHWGVYAISGNEWEGVSARHASPCSSWIRTWGGPTVPKNWKQTYDQLYKQFDPKDFNAQRKRPTEPLYSRIASMS